MLCNLNTHRMCLQKIHPQITDCEKKELTSSNDELVLILLNQKRNKQKFFVPPILKRKEQHAELHVEIQELKLYRDCFCTYFWMSVGPVELLLAEMKPYLRRHRNNVKSRL